MFYKIKLLRFNMKFVFCQISDKLINPKQDTLAEKFSDTFYENKKRDGYYRPEHFWELPKWVAEICHLIPDEHSKELLIIDDMRKGMALSSDKDVYYCFSVLDVNKDIIKQIIERNPQSQFILGGYVDSDFFCMPNQHNWVWYGGIKDFCYGFGFDYSYGCDWRLFADTECIPRLTLSKGCLNGCKFCTIPHKLEELPFGTIMQQAAAFIKARLKFKLVYIDDKTYGQAKNTFSLNDAYNYLKFYNPEFEGFIVQTTAIEVLERPSFLRKMDNIKYVEMGVETLNDNILKQYRKPHTRWQIFDATAKLYRIGIKVIWNIIIGFPEETAETYRNTIAFLEMWKPLLYSLNIYHLAAYGKDKDTDENSNNKSWLGDRKQIMADSFEESLYRLGLEIVE